MAEKALFAILSSDSTITAKVGDQISPLSAAQNCVLPFIVYSVVDYEPYLTHAAIIGGKTTIAVTVYAESYKEAAVIQRLVSIALSYKQGSYATLPVKSIQPSGKSSLQEINDGDVPIYGLTQDFIILHGER